MAIKFQGNLRDFAMFVGQQGGSALPVDPDPNTSEPSQSRMCTTSVASLNNTLTCTVAADAACTVEGWFWSEKFGKWCKLFSQALTALNASQILNIPGNAPMILRIVANGGGATMVGAFFA